MREIEFTEKQRLYEFRVTVNRDFSGRVTAWVDDGLDDALAAVQEEDEAGIEEAWHRCAELLHREIARFCDREKRADDSQFEGLARELFGDLYVPLTGEGSGR